MAAFFVSRRNLNLAILHKLRPASAAAAARPFTTEASAPGAEKPSGQGPSTAAGGVYDPFFPSRDLVHLMLNDGPFGALVSRGFATYPRRDFESWVDDSGLYIRLDMPGLGKEDVKVWLEGDTLLVVGGPSLELKGSEKERRYGCQFKMPAKMYKKEDIRSEIKNGVLKIVVPRISNEERAKNSHTINLD